MSLMEVACQSLGGAHSLEKGPRRMSFFVFCSRIFSCGFGKRKRLYEATTLVCVVRL